MKERKHKDRHRGPLATCVRNALERYIADLDGQTPGDLYAMVIAEVEAPLLEVAMQLAESNQCQAAKMLGINRNTLRKKLKLHGLES